MEYELSWPATFLMEYHTLKERFSAIHDVKTVHLFNPNPSLPPFCFHDEPRPCWYSPKLQGCCGQRRQGLQHSSWSKLGPGRQKASQIHLEESSSPLAFDRRIHHQGVKRLYSENAFQNYHSYHKLGLTAIKAQKTSFTIEIKGRPMWHFGMTSKSTWWGIVQDFEATCFISHPGCQLANPRHPSKILNQIQIKVYLPMGTSWRSSWPAKPGRWSP